MQARCIICSKYHKFRNQRGNKLSDNKCQCGGKLEMVGGDNPISGEHPFDATRTHRTKHFEGTYFYAEANRKKEYFVYHEGFFHKIENPVMATYIDSTKQLTNSPDK